MTDGMERPTDSDGYTVRITFPPSNRARFKDLAEASAFNGDVWELVGPDANVLERYEFSRPGRSAGGDER